MRDHPFALREVVDRAEVDVRVALVDERRDEREPDCRDGDDGADCGAEAERRALEELAARVARGLGRRRLRHGGRALVRGDGRSGLRRPLRLGVRRRDGRVAAADVPDPEEAEDERQRSADRHRRPADDQADEDANDADREANRPEARRRPVRRFAPRIHADWIQSSLSAAGQRRDKPYNPYSAQRRSTSSLISSVIRISGGHSRVPSSGPLWVASIPILPP